MTALATAEVAQADKEQHDAEVAQVKSWIEQAKLDLAAEKARMATRQAELDSQAYRLRLDHNAAQEVMWRRQRSHLPSVYEARNLFNTPGAGTSNHPEINRGGAPGTGASVQLPAAKPNRQVVPAQHVPTPPGH